jgi:hypothetical protein
MNRALPWSLAGASPLEIAMHLLHDAAASQLHDRTATLSLIDDAERLALRAEAPRRLHGDDQRLMAAAYARSCKLGIRIAR